MRPYHPMMLSILCLLTACTVPQPYRPTPAPGSPAPSESVPVPQTPGETPSEPPPTPQTSPASREPTLGAATRSLVGQAQTQLAAKNFAVAAASIERALRIEPDNALLWTELGKIRQAEGNYVQAENMGRKAVSMSANAPRAQSAAWHLIAESYRERERNVEAREAEIRAEQILRR
jgi:Flp pilus assembly protein TadD